MFRFIRRWREDDARRGGAEAQLTSGEVKSRAASGVALLLGRGLVFRIIGLLGNLVLARLLVPADFGLVAIGLVVVGVGQVLAGAGLGVQVINRAAEPTRRELRAITGMQLIITSAIGGIAAIVSIIVGGAALATAVMMLALPIVAMRSPATLLFSRRMHFSRTVVIEITEIVTYLVLAVALAASGLGVWSLVIATVLRSAAGAVVAIRLSPAGLVLPSWDPATLRPMLAFGARFQLTSIVNIGQELVLTAGIAAVAGLTVLGLQSFASRILQVPFLLFEALHNVGFPAFSRLYGAGQDEAAMKDLVIRLVTGMSIATAVLMCPIVAAAPAAVPLLFGDSWSGVSEILPGAGLALVMGGPISIVVFSLLYARGDAHTALVGSVAHSVARLAATLALLPFIGPWALGIGWWAGVLVEIPIALAGVRRLLDVRLAGCIVLPALLASIAAGAGWFVAEELGRTVVSVAASATVGLVAYLLLLLVLAPKHLRRAVTLLRSARQAVRPTSLQAT